MNFFFFFKSKYEKGILNLNIRNQGTAGKCLCSDEAVPVGGDVSRDAGVSHTAHSFLGRHRHFAGGVRALRVGGAESSNRTRHGRPWTNRAMRLAQLMNSLRGRTRARRGMPAARTAPGGGRRWAAGPRGARGRRAAGLDASRS